MRTQAAWGFECGCSWLFLVMYLLNNSFSKLDTLVLGQIPDASCAQPPSPISVRP